MGKDMTIAEYLAAQSEPLRGIGERMREIIDAQLPEGSGAMWHGHPVWSLGESPGKSPVCLLKAYPKHLTFGLWRGREIVDPSGRIDTAGSMAQVRLRGVDDIDPVLFADWLRQVRELESAASR